MASMSSHVPNAGVELAIGHGGEAPVGCGRKGRQDVHTTEQPGEGTVQECGERLAGRHRASPDR